MRATINNCMGWIVAVLLLIGAFGASISLFFGCVVAAVLTVVACTGCRIAFDRWGTPDFEEDE